MIRTGTTSIIVVSWNRSKPGGPLKRGASGRQPKSFLRVGEVVYLVGFMCRRTQRSNPAPATKIASGHTNGVARKHVNRVMHGRGTRQGGQTLQTHLRWESRPPRATSFVMAIGEGATGSRHVWTTDPPRQRVAITVQPTPEKTSLQAKKVIDNDTSCDYCLRYPFGDGPHAVLRIVRATGGKGKLPATPPEMV